jgi:hypothetical protein
MTALDVAFAKGWTGSGDVADVMLCAAVERAAALREGIVCMQNALLPMKQAERQWAHTWGMNQAIVRRIADLVCPVASLRAKQWELRSGLPASFVSSGLWASLWASQWAEEPEECARRRRSLMLLLE